MLNINLTSNHAYILRHSTRTLKKSSTDRLGLKQRDFFFRFQNQASVPSIPAGRVVWMRHSEEAFASMKCWKPVLGVAHFPTNQRETEGVNTNIYVLSLSNYTRMSQRREKTVRSTQGSEPASAA